MGAKAKIAALCALCAAGVFTIGYSAYVVSDSIMPELGAYVSADGVEVAENMLSSSVTPPRGNEDGISPLTAEYVIDLSAAIENNVADEDGTVRLTIVIGYAQGVIFPEDESVASDVIYGGVFEVTEAYLPANGNDGGKHIDFSCRSEVLGGETSQPSFRAVITLPAAAAGGAKTCLVSVSFSAGGEGEQRLNFFRQNSSALFEVTAALS